MQQSSNMGNSYLTQLKTSDLAKSQAKMVISAEPWCYGTAPAGRDTRRSLNQVPAQSTEIRASALSSWILETSKQALEITQAFCTTCSSV